MVALQENCFVTLTPVDQHIDHLARRWSAVDIIAQKYLYGPLRPNTGEVMVDCREDLCELIGASMDIADGIDASSIRQSRFARFGRVLPGALNAPEDRFNDQAPISAGLSNGEHFFRDESRKAKGAREIVEAPKRLW